MLSSNKKKRSIFGIFRKFHVCLCIVNEELTVAFG